MSALNYTPSKGAMSSHAKYDAHTQSINYTSFFESLLEIIMNDEAFSNFKDDLKISFGKGGEETIFICGESWKPDLVISYKGKILLVGEAFTSRVKPGKLPKAEQEPGPGGKKNYKTIDTTIDKTSLDYPSVKNEYDSKLGHFDRLDMECQETGAIKPKKYLLHVVTIETKKPERHQQAVNYYLNNDSINVKYINIKMDKKYCSVLYNKTTTEDSQIHGKTSHAFLQSMIEDLLEMIEVVDNDPNIKSVKKPMGGQYTSKQSKKRVSELRNDMSEKLKVIGVYSKKGTMADLDVLIHEYANDNFDDMMENSGYGAI